MGWIAIKFDKTDVWGFEHALRGMRNPLDSHQKSDSIFSPTVKIGENDMNLAKRLISAGPEHRKFLRQIMVSVDITGPLFWFKEFDTYKNSKEYDFLITNDKDLQYLYHQVDLFYSKYF